MQGRVPGVHEETEETQSYSLYYYRKKTNVQFDTKIIKKGNAAERDVFLPELAAIVKNGCVRQFWYLYPLVSNFHDI